MERVYGSFKRNRYHCGGGPPQGASAAGPLTWRRAAGLEAARLLLV